MEKIKMSFLSAIVAMFVLYPASLVLTKILSSSSFYLGFWVRLVLFCVVFLGGVTLALIFMFLVESKIPKS